MHVEIRIIVIFGGVRLEGNIVGEALVFSMFCFLILEKVCSVYENSSSCSVMVCEFSAYFSMFLLKIMHVLKSTVSSKAKAITLPASNARSTGSTEEFNFCGLSGIKSTPEVAKDPN